MLALLLLASVTDKIVEPIVDIATEFIGSAGVVAVFCLMTLESACILRWADNWFERYGSFTVFFSRMLPIIRTFISLPAGVARMPFWRFTALTVLGSIPWVLGLALVGEKVGNNWEDWRHKLGYLDYLVAAAIIVGVIYWIVKRRRGGPDPDEGEPGVPAEVTSTSGV